MAEDLTTYYQELGVKVRYLHSDIETLERVEILRDLRRGAFDVLVGINLLREGLDLPGGVARRDPRRGQGGVPALGRFADSDIRPCGAARRRPGDHVCRDSDRLHEVRHRRDRTSPGAAGGVQRGAWHHAGIRRAPDRRAAVERLRARLLRSRPTESRATCSGRRPSSMPRSRGSSSR